MPNEFQRLEQLQSELRLIGRGSDTFEMQRFCSAFTQEAARMLHGEGWRRIRKPDGQNVDGMDIDKLVNANTFQVVDIIASAGIASARVAWQIVGELRDTSRFIEVRPVDVPGTGTGGAPPIGDDAAIELADAVDIVAKRVVESNLHLKDVLTELRTLNRQLEVIGRHLGAL